MSKTVRLYIGLPGSGKTYRAQKECDLVIDDITDLSEMPSEITVNSLGITDVNFCDALILQKAISKIKEMYENIHVSLVYFENDSTKCRTNIEYRNDGRNVEGTIRRFEEIYCPPETALDIWSKHNES